MNILCKVTLENLRKNKVRTIVTIVGIILSVTMITAVLESGVSFQQYMINYTIEETGSFHGAVFDMDEEEAEALTGDKEVDNAALIQNLGFARYDGITNEDKPYIFVGAVGDNFTDLVSVHITSGRMPENSGEILIPSHLKTNGGVSLNLGDVITLDLGTREYEGETLTNHYMYNEGETLIDTKTRTYTVVGFYERFSYSIETYDAAGYTALTAADGTGPDNFDVYFTLNDIKNTSDFLVDNYGETGEVTKWNVNSSLLRSSFVLDAGSMKSVLYSFMAILIVIIMFGSITLIYNAFSISVSERMKQFGILKSIGATNKQVIKSVLFETAVLCAIGIPIGLLCGCVGIGVTFYLLSDRMSVILANEYDIALSLAVRPAALLIAAGIGFVTILISAYIPARKANKISAIDAISQTSDISIKQKKIKTPKIIYRLFGFEGMIAAKNFKRSKKKYRATVWSLFASIVLFISTCGFCSYLVKTINISDTNLDYDIYYRLYDSDRAGHEEVYNVLKNVKGVTDIVEVTGYDYELLTLDKSCYTSQFFENEFYEDEGSKDTSILEVMLLFVNDDDYEAYLNDAGLDAEKYMDSQNPIGLIYDYTQFSVGDKHYAYNTIKESELPAEGTITYTYYDSEDAVQDAESELPVTIGGVVRERPYFVGTYCTLMYPMSAYEAVIGTRYDYSYDYYIVSSNHKATYEKAAEELNNMGIDTGTMYDYANSIESSRTFIFIIRVFVYGFIILISLIAVANVFNTISTNILLRRREFAMLKSVGMTNKSFNKMMNYECLLYGMKGLIYGIPVGILLTYILFGMIVGYMGVSFFIPAYGIIISVVGVFFVVFITMIYSMHKIKKDNTIDALKNENL